MDEEIEKLKGKESSKQLFSKTDYSGEKGKYFKAERIY